MQSLPQDPIKLMSLVGAFCSDLGLHERALAIHQQLARLRDDDSNALVTLAVSQSRAGDEAAACATLQRALQRDPAHDMARVMWAIHLHKAGDTANARVPLLAVLADGQDADARALAASVKDDILSPLSATVPSVERNRRHRYTRVDLES
jgi:Tfp pilus assembly protein PilF